MESEQTFGDLASETWHWNRISAGLRPHRMLNSKWKCAIPTYFECDFNLHNAKLQDCKFGILHNLKEEWFRTFFELGGGVGDTVCTFSRRVSMTAEGTAVSNGHANPLCVSPMKTFCSQWMTLSWWVFKFSNKCNVFVVLIVLLKLQARKRPFSTKFLVIFGWMYQCNAFRMLCIQIFQFQQKCRSHKTKRCFFLWLKEKTGGSRLIQTCLIWRHS